MKKEEAEGMPCLEAEPESWQTGGAVGGRMSEQRPRGHRVGENFFGDAGEIFSNSNDGL